MSVIVLVVLAIIHVIVTVIHVVVTVIHVVVVVVHMGTTVPLVVALIVVMVPVVILMVTTIVLVVILIRTIVVLVLTRAVLVRIVVHLVIVIENPLPIIVFIVHMMVTDTIMIFESITHVCSTKQDTYGHLILFVLQCKNSVTLLNELICCLIATHEQVMLLILITLPLLIFTQLFSSLFIDLLHCLQNSDYIDLCHRRIIDILHWMFKQLHEETHHLLIHTSL